VVEAPEAQRIGLLNHLVPCAELRDKTLWEEVTLPQEENEPVHSQSARATAGSSV